MPRASAFECRKWSDQIGLEQWPPSPARKAQVPDAQDVDVRCTADEPFLQQFRAFLDEGVEPSVVGRLGQSPCLEAAEALGVVRAGWAGVSGLTCSAIPREGPFGKEQMYQRLRLRAADTLDEEITLAAAAVGEWQSSGGLDGVDRLERRDLPWACIARAAPVYSWKTARSDASKRTARPLVRGQVIPSAARCRARAIAASITSVSSGITSSIRPEVSAWVAETDCPLTHISSAILTPVKRGNRCVPPAPGMTPNRTSGCPSWVLTFAIR